MNSNYPQAIVLAAGKSSRLPGFKPLLPLNNKTIIEQTVLSFYNSCSKIVVVCGYRHNDIAKILSEYAKVELVINKNYVSGMFGSVIEGVKKISSERFFILPADMPLIKEDTIKKLLESYSEILIPSCNGKKGHPVLLNRKLIPELLSDKTVLSLKDFIQNRTFTVMEVDDEGILFDIDTEEDYKSVMSYFK